MSEEPKFKVGDLVRSVSDSNANTVYRIVGVKEHVKMSRSWYEYTVKGVFGLFKQDYKASKRYRSYAYVKVTLLDLANARAKLDQFIQAEAKRLSGEGDEG